ncbi:uncharacterized protein A1O9_10358 [Exophiala aquamarina CBS 119918]|uniref:Uncharacterized protein n=1 Tax=Exophiala aquamarina CBS 119918 TaxID=1182545 RepID=A0A072P284_9EURO|nr:uncharacterized protein A1O9_10358 [Exophiala aquamarina CBS 119918]KEF53383.1 hypothetical protein A1O9_10358 [Exophiala aquamarina CBS 119918]
MPRPQTQEGTPTGLACAAKPSRDERSVPESRHHEAQEAKFRTAQNRKGQTDLWQDYQRLYPWRGP